MQQCTAAPQVSSHVGLFGGRQACAAAVLLILVALGVAIFGTIRLTRSLEPGQRAVAWLVFVIAVVCLVVELIRIGLLGSATE